MAVTIENFTHGEYSIALYNDLHSDEKCNLNFIGIPKEPYGFFNDVKRALNAPSFESTKIVLNANRVIRIELL